MNGPYKVTVTRACGACSEDAQVPAPCECARTDADPSALVVSVMAVATPEAAREAVFWGCARLPHTIATPQLDDPIWTEGGEVRLPDGTCITVEQTTRARLAAQLLDAGAEDTPVALDALCAAWNARFAAYNDATRGEGR